VTVLQARQLGDHFLIPGTDRRCFFIFSIHTGSKANAYEEHLMRILQGVCFIADLNTTVL